MSTDTAEAISVNVSDVVQFLRFDGQFGPALRNVVERKVAAQEARDRGLSISDEELQDAANTFRQANGLQQADDAREWLESRGLELDDLEQILEENLLISKLKDELREEADEEEFIQSDEIQSHLRERVYDDWLQSQLGG